MNSSEYKRNNVKTYQVYLNKKYDKELIQFIEGQPNKMRFLRELVLREMIYQKMAEERKA